MWETETFNDSASCQSYDQCHMDNSVAVGEVCMGEGCIWYMDTNTCFCNKIADPFSPTNGCDACKYETPSPTFYGECNCTSELGASVFGIEDSNGVCQCDVDFLEGNNCEGGFGSGVFDSGIVPFVIDTCHWDPYLDLWRQISCIDHHNISVEWFSDDACSQLLNGLDVQNDTCYYIDGTPISEEPTANPTISPVETDPPTPGPTMTASPTLSPIVISNQLCDFDSLLLQLNDTFYQIGDTQWIDDCLQLLDARTHQLSIVCGCVGKFQHSMANQYLNCVLEQPWHGLTVWNMCQSSIYSQSCGSQCTGWLRRRQSQQEISHNRRRAVANSTFKLIWSEAVCQIEPTFEPSSLPTSSPTDDPAYDPTNEPTDYPSTSPTDDPTNEPTDSPTNNPTDFPTAEPTDFPTAYPTSNPTVAPTSEPTDVPTCIKYETWTDITANETCPNGSWGNTDRGYGSMVACDSNLQAKLEESAANRLFHLCSSYCIYDYHSLLAQQQAAYIWKSSQQCYLAVDRWTCFSGHAYQIFVGLQDYAAAICQNSTSS